MSNLHSSLTSKQPWPIYHTPLVYHLCPGRNLSMSCFLRKRKAHMFLCFTPSAFLKLTSIIIIRNSEETFFTVLKSTSFCPRNSTVAEKESKQFYTLSTKGSCTISSTYRENQPSYVVMMQNRVTTKLYTP